MRYVLVAILAFSLIASTFSQGASAQYEGGGVSKEGSWYVGEGLKKGDQFSYSLCHTDYKDCSPFQIHFWVEGSQKVGSEDQWKLQVVVYDGAKTLVGTMNLGKIAPEPIGNTPNLTTYAAAFKSSIVWLSAYATADPTNNSIKGPKEFTQISWGKIGNIGGQQIIPKAEEKIAVPEGIFDTVVVGWRTGGKDNRVWVVDDFPFPVKADTYQHVSSGIPPQEYRFELLSYQQNVNSNPFANIKGTEDVQAGLNCPTNTDEFITINKNTNTNSMIVNLKYAPPKPKQDCEMDLIINFKRKVSQEEFENEVHYDIWVVDSNLEKKRSIAEEEKRNALFTTAGQVRRDIVIKESGPTTYAILVYGTGPETSQPNIAKSGYITFDVDVQKGAGGTTTPPAKAEIPDWIKKNAGWWADGTIGDSDFVSGIQYLINQKIIKIPSTSTGSTGSSKIPDWIKKNAGWWADGTIGDSDFVQGIQYLIKQGIIKLK